MRSFKKYIYFIFPRSIPEGALTFIKYFALLCMTGDHINKYLFNGTLPLLFETGRLAMPLFGFVLAYNLARPHTLERGVYRRVMRRLFISGLSATFPFVALGGQGSGLFPTLNVLFTLLIITGVLCFGEYAYQKNRSDCIVALLIFLVAGNIGEFGLVAIFWSVFIWGYYRCDKIRYLLIALIPLLGFRYINGNNWALLSLPVLILSFRITYSFPRLRNFFYFYYPLHLFALWLIRIPMQKVGYLFFT